MNRKKAIKTIFQLGALGAIAYYSLDALPRAIEQSRKLPEDWANMIRNSPTINEVLLKYPKIRELRGLPIDEFIESIEDVEPSELDTIPAPEPIKPDTITAPKYTLEGRIQRTQRWKEKIAETEKKYNIPEGLIAAVIMRESYGDPLTVNSQNDGGSGLGCLQPGIAIYYGLKTYKNAIFTGANKKYGKDLLKLLVENNYDLAKVSEKHEPFDPEKSIEVIGNFLHDLHTYFKKKKVKDPWKAAVAAYNCGPKRVSKYVSKNKGFDEVKFYFKKITQNHVEKILEYREIWNNRKPIV